jgi:hypothetical protein
VLALASAAGMLESTGAGAGTIFREVQVTEQDAPPTSVRLVREVLSEGEDCKILHEESTDPLAPAGSYILATASDAFIVDPARATVSPVDPTRMVPASDEIEPRRAIVSGITLVRELDEAGPALLGLATRHYVYVLRYDLLKPADAGAPIAVHHQERHDFVSVPWGGSLAPSPTWQAWRVSEDAGLGPERTPVREAIESLHAQGFMLRHSIDRQITGASGDGTLTEHVRREVTALASRPLDARVFARPDGYAPAEFLAPAPDDAEPPSAEGPGGGKDAGDAAAGGK